jgi:hypothetical protein
MAAVDVVVGEMDDDDAADNKKRWRKEEDNRGCLTQVRSGQVRSRKRSGSGSSSTKARVPLCCLA